MNRIILLIFISGVLVLTSCKKDTAEPIISEETSIEEIVFPSSFDWKTFKEIPVSVTGYANSIMKIVSDDGTVYQKVFLQMNETYSGKFTVPAYETTIHLIYMGQKISFELSNGSISHQFNL